MCVSVSRDILVFCCGDVIVLHCVPVDYIVIYDNTSMQVRLLCAH